MDDKTLTALRAALDASPDNRELRMVLVAGHLERGEAEAASALLAGLGGGALSSEHRLLAARALLAAGRPAEALERLGEEDGEATEALLVRSEVLHALGRGEEARERYRQAVAANPALESPELRDRLGATVREVEAAGGRRLRLISNVAPEPEGDLDALLAPPEERVTFADVGGLEEIKREIRRRIILPFQKPTLFRRFRKRAGGGILLYGPPGCGKTLLARATAGECQAAFFNVAISDVLDMYIGESERKLHALFEKARAEPPAVLFFDELEALGGKRMYSREASASKLVSTFLSEMDGFQLNNQGVLVLAATNLPWAVDPAFRRPGRFDRMLFVPPPDQTARAAILDLLLAGRPLALAGDDAAALARKTSGFTGADLRNLVDTAADLAIEDSIAGGREEPIAARHLWAALGEVKPTSLEWLTTARNYARYANEGGQYDDVLRVLERHGKS
jgi:SpoVK/Ycf46/Vps4 family AAA+-type ATPase